MTTLIHAPPPNHFILHVNTTAPASALIAVISATVGGRVDGSCITGQHGTYTVEALENVDPTWRDDEYLPGQMYPWHVQVEPVLPGDPDRQERQVKQVYHALLRRGWMVALSGETRLEDPEASQAAGVMRRGVAYLVDAALVVVPMAALWFSLVPGAEDVWAAYLEDRTLDNRIAFLQHRNMVRDLSALALVFYGAILESSPLEGTLGKRLLGVRVQTFMGRRLSFWTAFRRNQVKLFGVACLMLGWLWALTNPMRLSLHDLQAGTRTRFQAYPTHWRDQTTFKETHSSLRSLGWSVLMMIYMAWVSKDIVALLRSALG